MADGKGWGKELEKWKARSTRVRFRFYLGWMRAWMPRLKSISIESKVYLRSGKMMNRKRLKTMKLEITCDLYIEYNPTFLMLLYHASINCERTMDRYFFFFFPRAKIHAMQGLNILRTIKDDKRNKITHVF